MGLWLAVLLYFFWCFLVHPQGQVLRGNFPDPDDYMYLVQVMDWLKGAGWYDNIQHRLDPPAGGPIHFTRIPQIPMALLIMLFEAIGLPARGAAMLTAIILPLFLCWPDCFLSPSAGWRGVLRALPLGGSNRLCSCCSPPACLRCTGRGISIITDLFSC